MLILVLELGQSTWMMLLVLQVIVSAFSRQLVLPFKANTTLLSKIVQPRQELGHSRANMAILQPSSAAALRTAPCG